MTYTTHQMALIERHRDINVDYEWYDCVYDRFIEFGNELKLDIARDDIQFSGFWSQGDGASFTFTSYGLGAVLEGCTEFVIKHDGLLGTPHTGLTEAHRKALVEDRLYSAFLSFAQGIVQTFEKYRLCGQGFIDDHMECVSIHARRISYHYSNARTVSTGFDIDNAGLDAAKESLGVDLEADLDHKWIDREIENIADALYRALEEEYNYLTSDDAVWESIVANELDEPEEEDVDG